MKNFPRILAILAALALGGCMSTQLQTGLSEPEAREIVATLSENGVDAQASRDGAAKKDGTAWTVRVRGSDQTSALAWRVLRENGLPREKDRGLEDVFSGGGMIPTAGEEKARMLAAIAGEIARTLKTVGGVVDARVHVVLPENSPLVDKKDWNRTTASVLLKYQGDQPPLKDDEIRNLVARGVEGLQPADVAIVPKRVVPKAFPERSFAWYLGNQQLLETTMALLAITAIATLVLLGRVAGLKSQLATAAKKQ
jgi:type III secretion protein J